jgi:hypothetical protein
MAEASGGRKLLDNVVSTTCGEADGHLSHVSHAVRGRTAHQLRINGPLGEHTQAAQGRVRASDALDTGKVIRLLTIVDECTRESPAIEVDTSLGKFRVRRVLDRIALERGPLEAIVLDNGPFSVLWQESSAVCKSASLARSPPPMCFHYSDQNRAGFAFLIARGGIAPVLSGYGQPIP